jgi:hypothetical protein
VSITASVTRATVPGGPLADLPLVSADYDIDFVGPGALAWQRVTVESKWVHGRFLVSARKDVEIMPLGVEVSGATAAGLDASTRALLDAFEQWSYDLTVVADGVSHTWRCEPAEYAPAGGRSGGRGTYEPFGLQAPVFVQSYVFQIPRNPVPIAGSM